MKLCLYIIFQLINCSSLPEWSCSSIAPALSCSSTAPAHSKLSSPTKVSRIWPVVATMLLLKYAVVLKLQKDLSVFESNYKSAWVWGSYFFYCLSQPLWWLAKIYCKLLLWVCRRMTNWSFVNFHPPWESLSKTIFLNELYTIKCAKS